MEEFNEKQKQCLLQVSKVKKIVNTKPKIKQIILFLRLYKNMKKLSRILETVYEGYIITFII